MRTGRRRTGRMRTWSWRMGKMRTGRWRTGTVAGGLRIGVQIAGQVGRLRVGGLGVKGQGE